MGGIKVLIGRIIEFFKKDVNGINTPNVDADTGGDIVKTASYYSTSGDDSPPLADDAIAMVQAGPSGLWVNLGVLDLINESTANPGERILYARDVSGEIKCRIYLHNDGKIRIFNIVGGEISLNTNGSVDINGVNIDLAGNMTNVTSINGIVIESHTHPYTWTGSPGSGNTGGPS